MFALSYTMFALSYTFGKGLIDLASGGVVDYFELLAEFRVYSTGLSQTLLKTLNGTFSSTFRKWSKSWHRIFSTLNLEV